MTDSGKALSPDRIEKILLDLRNEPPWRTEAQREADFYDGNQLKQATLARMEEQGIPPIIVNLIKPTVDTVLGLEAKTRTDPIVRPENKESKDGTEALNQKLKEALRMSRFNRGCADGFANQVKAGLGWVEISRNSDPFAYQYRTRSVHWREIWTDWRAREPDYSDARYLVRRKWYDADELVTHFPKHKKLINQTISMRPAWEGDDVIDEALGRAWDMEQTTSLTNEEWRDTERHRLAMYEVWYKVFSEVWVLDLPDGRVVELNKKDPRHIEAVAAGLLEPRKARTQRIRVAYYLGPHQLEDDPSPYTHGRFPYVPMVGYREDRSGAPYGLIRGMKSPQEEVNARRSKMLYNLSTRRVITDEDAVKDHKQTAGEVARSDSYIVLNQNRRNANGFKIDTDAGLNQQQFQLMLEAKQNVQDSSGLFHEMMGQGAGSGQSGEAIKSLVEQGIQVLGELMDNYSEARRSAAEMLLSMIVDDMSGRNDVLVEVERPEGGTRSIQLNHPDIDELGYRIRTNDVTRLQMQVALDEAPSSITYRQQILGRMMDVVQTLPDELKAATMDLLVDASDLPNRRAFVDRIRAVTGFGPETDEDGEGGEEKAMMQQQQQQMEAQAAQEQQAMQQQVMQMEMEKARATLDELSAKARKAIADAEYAEARARKLSGVDSMHEEIKARKTLSEIEQEDRNQLRRDIELDASLRQSAEPRYGSQGLPPTQHDPRGQWPG